MTVTSPWSGGATGRPVTLLTNNGAGAFSQARVLNIATFASVPGRRVRRLGRRHGPDLAVSGVSADGVWVLENTATSCQTLYPAGFTAFDMRAADIDNDGDVDILSTDFNSSAGEFVLLRNNGNGTFRSGQSSPAEAPTTWTSPTSTATAVPTSP